MSWGDFNCPDIIVTWLESFGVSLSYYLQPVKTELIWTDVSKNKEVTMKNKTVNFKTPKVTVLSLN